MKRQAILLEVYENPVRNSSIVNELIDLYFCNGWHRPGGKHPVQDSARNEVLSRLTQSGNLPTQSHTRGQPAPSTANNTRDSAPNSVNPSVEERRRSSRAHSPERQRRQESLPSPATRHRQRPAPLPLGNPREADSRNTSRSPLTNEKLIKQLAQRTQTPPAVDLPRGRNQEGISTGNIGNRRSARLQAQRNAAPFQASTTTLQPATLQREEREAIPVAVRRSPRFPAQRFSEVPAHRADPRLNRVVDVNGDCTICTSAFGDAQNVARCNQCCNDYHIGCILRWFTDVNLPSCCFW